MQIAKRQATIISMIHSARRGPNKIANPFSFNPSTGPEKLFGKSKGLVQLSPQLYSRWGFLTFSLDKQLKFSAYA